MAPISDASELEVLCKSPKVEWKIRDYFSIPEETGTFVESPSFYCLGTTWNILIYPNASFNKSYGFLALYLVVRNPTSNPILYQSYDVSFKLHFQFEGFGIPVTLRESIFTSSFLNDTFGFLAKITNWTVHSLRDNLRNTPSSETTLIVYCEIAAKASCIKSTACQAKLSNDKTLLSRDFQDLLQTGRQSDLTIEVQGHLFQVHSLILQARSSVFTAMFSHDMKEKIEKRVKIDDCDPHTFQEFLHYMYTGNVENLSWENVLPLLSVAEKYLMFELKEQCKEFMAKSNMSVETVCDIVVVADSHNAMQLKKRAEDFLIRNIIEIKTTKKWKLFMDEYPSMALEILMKCIPDIIVLEQHIQPKNM